MKLLIVNFWDPENTKYFGKYSDAIDILVRTLKDSEIFSIAFSREAEEPLKEKVGGLQRAIEHAKVNSFDRLFILGEGIILTPTEFQKMAEIDSEVVLTKKEDFSCCLIRVRTLEVYPIPYLGEFSPPDKMWLKLLRQNGIKISIINGVKTVCLSEL